ncbi:MAG: hypothetical protein ACTTJ6_07970 [Treponema sp.]
MKYKERKFGSDYLGTHNSETQEFYGINNHSGYVYFRCEGLNFQTEKEVTIEKRKMATLTITDDTFVLICGKVKTRVKLSEIDSHHVVLINNTSYDLYSINFTKDKILQHKDVLTKDNYWYAGFSYEMEKKCI